MSWSLFNFNLCNISTGLLKYKNATARYKQMLFYVEACYAGSMFNKLSPDVNITAHTASNNKESSYACVLDEELDVYLGKINVQCLQTLANLNGLSIFKHF